MHSRTTTECMRKGLPTCLKMHLDDQEQNFWPDPSTVAYASPITDFFKAENVHYIPKLVGR